MSLVKVESFHVGLSTFDASAALGTTLWTLDESCSIYVRTDVLNETQWSQLDQIQFGQWAIQRKRNARVKQEDILLLEWTRRMIHMVCNSAGVWAVDDHGHIHFRHGHACSSHSIDSNDVSVLPPAWITIPGSPEKQRTFSQIYCGPADWMVRLMFVVDKLFFACDG